MSISIHIDFVINPLLVLPVALIGAMAITTLISIKAIKTNTITETIKD